MVLWCSASQDVFAATDARLIVEINEADAVGLAMEDVLPLALPVLWQRVVATSDVVKANKLKASTSLLLQYQTIAHGVRLTFNSNQVKRFLSRAGIDMIMDQPHWNLSVNTLGLSEQDKKISQDLTDYGHAVADRLGVNLSPRGKKMQVMFAPVLDAYGQAWIHMDLQGAFPASLLSQTEMPATPFLSNQLQDWLQQTLTDIRDAYAKGNIEMLTPSSEVWLTVEGEHTLASQVMLEQALLNQASVASLIPAVIQSSRRIYRLILQGQDETWIPGWFLHYGMTATREPQSDTSAWQVE